MKPKGLAIVGLGMALDPHAKALADLPDTYEVKHAYSRSVERREAAAARYGLPVTGDLEAIVGDPDTHAALILTPPDSHFEIVQRFLNAGKDVLVEKPLDVSSARGAELVAMAQRLDRRLGVVLQHRFRESSRELSRLLEGGELGRIAAATCSVPWWRDQAYYDEPGRGTLARDGGGVLMTQAIHTLDLYRALVGGVRRVASVAETTPLHRLECEDFVAGVLHLENGAVGSLLATTAAYPGLSESIELICENGVARLGGGALRIDWLDGRVTEIAAEQALGGGSDPMDFPADAHRNLLQDFASAVEQGRDPLVSGREALQTQVLIDALIRAAGRATWEDVPPS